MSHHVPLLSRSLVCLCAVVVNVLEKWARHRTTDDAEDNVAQWGSFVIEKLVTEDTRARWLAAGAEGVLRGIAAGTSNASKTAKILARSALKDGLGLWA